MRQKLSLFLLLLTLGIMLIACDSQTDRAGEKVSTNKPAGNYSDDGVPLGRLPRNVLPVHYRLELEIVPDRTTFTGHTEIDLDIRESTDRFYIHGERLRVSQSRLQLADGRTIDAGYEEYNETGIVRITLPEPVSGMATLIIDYSADFNESLEALYRVKSGGEYYAFTQFEAISARLAFPGFDEPSFKVPFDQVLIVDQAHETIAGTPIVETQLLDNGLKRVRFATTKPLPAYLLVYAVGPLDIVTAPDLPPTEVRDHPIPLRGVAAKGKGHLLGYALENTEGILTSLESYFSIPYPYTKLDIIAVPDFDAGAMENAGAITYREQLLLFDDSASIRSLRRFVAVHAHELAHQWFGDLVTPVWWDDIWLNEAFATWMAAVGLDIWKPEEGFRRYLNERMLAVMESDSLVNARQIRQPVLSNHDIASAFDRITYSKGGGVLGMFESLLGREAFRKGVHNYLVKFSHGVATSDDFIAALAEQSTEIPAEQVASSFRSFLEQPGLPIVETTLSCTNSSVSVNMKQSRFLPLGSKGSTDSRWEIPVCMSYAVAGDKQRTCLLLTETEQNFDLPASQCPDYLMPNADSAGYYRWSLPDADWNRLLTAINSLSTEESMSLTASLNGAFNAGKIDVKAYINIAGQISKHHNWMVATAPMAELGFIHDKLARGERLPVLEQQYAGMYSGQLDRVGLAAPGNNEDAKLQQTVVQFMVDQARVDLLREELKAIAWAYTGFPDSAGIFPEHANPNLVSIALRMGIELDDVDNSFAKHVINIVLESTDARVRQDLLTALGYVSSPEMADRVLDLVLSDEIRDNEHSYILIAQIGQGLTQDATWLWLTKNIDAVLERLPTWNKANVIYVGDYFCNPEKRQQLDEFFAPRTEEWQGAPRYLAQKLEVIDLCIAKKKFHQPGFDEFMHSR